MRTTLSVEQLENRDVPTTLVTYADNLVIKYVDGVRVYSVNPYPGFPGEVHIAIGDTDNDGVPEVVTAAGAGGGPHVRVFDGKSAQLKADFYAYDPAFLGGVNVTVGNVQGDNKAEIITGPGKFGGPHVKIFASNLDGSFRLFQQFFAGDPRNIGGVQVAVQGQQLVTTTFPMFASRPDLIGKKEIYLAFSGDVSVEQIGRIWSRVAHYYAAYDINITTVPPTSTTDRWGMVLVGGDASLSMGWTSGLIDDGVLGIATVSGAFSLTSFELRPAFVFAKKIGWEQTEKVAEAVAHEIGHLLGLVHSNDPRSIMFSNALVNIGGFFLPVEDAIIRAVLATIPRS